MLSALARRATHAKGQVFSKPLFQSVRHSSKEANVSNTAYADAVSKHSAYEEAMQLITKDKHERLSFLTSVEKEIARVSKTSTPQQAAQLKALEALQFDLQVKAELNDPQVQKNYRLGHIDMARPVYRYMRQVEFNKAPRDKLMERTTQMNVIPDVVPLGFTAKVELEIRVKEGEAPIVPGVFVKPDETVERPEMRVTNFHTDTRLYTLMLVDPDVPDVAQRTYQQYCHWLVTNMPLSATDSLVKGGDSVLDYIPPHPQKGTKYHRYTLIAFEQPNGGKDRLNVDAMKREHFDAKAFASNNHLTATGLSFFREEWDASVSTIYKDILGTNEPVYGKPPKPQRYIQRSNYI
ncbi:phosphatidylethanolamine-binding protein [Spinellus fusiger]|nr:phosphatidylethanolamine-binding protein [Spinellus fusiger]